MANKRTMYSPMNMMKIFDYVILYFFIWNILYKYNKLYTLNCENV